MEHLFLALSLPIRLVDILRVSSLPWVPHSAGGLAYLTGPPSVGHVGVLYQSP